MRGPELYRDLLDLCLLETKAPSGLAIYPASSDQDNAIETAAYLFPKNLLSEYWDRFPVDSPEPTFPAVTATTIEERQPSAVFLAPPINSAAPSHLRVRFPRMGIHEIAVAEALRTLSSDSQLLTLLPAGTLTSSSSPRKVFLSGWQPTIVISNEGRQNLFPQVHASFRYVVLVLAPRTSNWRPLRMFRIPPPSSGDDHDVVGDFRALLGHQRGRSRFGYVINEPLAPDAPLAFERYDPEVLQRREELAGLGELRRLEEIADLVAGLHLTNDANRLLKDDAGVPVIEGRVITRTGQLDLRSVRYWAIPGSHRLPLLQPGDICVRAITGPSEGPLAAAVVEASQLPLTLSEGVLVIRPRPEFRRVSNYLAQYLRSARAWELLRAEGLVTHLTSRMIRQLVAPLPETALLEPYEDLRHTIAVLDTWRQEAEAAGESLFYEGSAEAARERLLAARLVRQRVEAAALLDDLGWRARARFPFPIARRWAKAQAAADNTDGYVSVLEAAEILLCYAAIVAVVMARASGQPVRWLSQIGNKLRSGRGLTFGDWHQILVDAATDEVFQSLPPSTPFREVVDFFADTEIKEAAERLRSDHRNRMAHLRRPTGLALIRAFDEAKADLLQLLQAAEFLADFPPRLVTATRWDSLRSQATIAYRELMGADTMVPMADANYAASDIEADSLYLADRSGTWHLLRPLLVARHCPTCNALAIFRPDKYERRTGHLTLQSLDHEHTAEGDDLSPALQAAGLLSSQAQS